MKSHVEAFNSIVGPDHVITDDQKMALGKDWTKAYAPNPLLIVQPSTTEEVSRILKYCNDQGLKVVPSGGRTGLSGGAVATNQEVVVSATRMRKIFGINKIEKTIHCQAGVVTKDLQKAAWDSGLYFPVDFASSGSSHIAGNVATNAGGIKVVRYGLIREWVSGMKVVLADGTILDLLNPCVKNNTGYDLKHLFVGSEGTLGFITEVRMGLTVQPGNLTVSLFALENLENVTFLFSLAQEMKLPIMAYEFFTETCRKLVEEHTHLKPPFSTAHPFYALLEVEKVSDDQLQSFVEAAFEKGLITDGVMAQSSQQASDFWGMRENIAESITALTTAHKNDISLPLSHITEFCHDLQATIDSEYKGFEVANFGHIGDGNLHVNFIKPEGMSKDDFYQKHTKKADLAMFNLVKKYHGSISAEHGVGLVKKDFLHFTRSPEELHAMKAIKLALDPKNTLNPGKVFDINEKGN